MLQISAENKFSDGEQLVVVKDTKAPHNPLKYYAVKEKNTDKFIKEQKGLYTAVKFNKHLTLATSLVGGIYTATAVNNKFLKGFVGLLSGLGLYHGLNYIDTATKNKGMQNSLKRNEARDITDYMIKNYQQH